MSIRPARAITRLVVATRQATPDQISVRNRDGNATAQMDYDFGYYAPSSNSSLVGSQRSTPTIANFATAKL